MDRQSQYDKGGHFMVAPNDRHDACAAIDSREPLLRDLNILLADDDQTFVHLAEIALVDIKAQLDTAGDGASAFTRLLEGDYDLAILDLSMPLTDGFRLLSYIRHTPRLRHLPVVVVTSRDDTHAAQEVSNLGADLMLVKPVDWVEFPHRICDAVRARRQLTMAA